MFGNIIFYFKIIYWTNYFKYHCKKFGLRMRITGRVVFTGGGKILCGDDLLIKSNLFDSVKIHIGPNASLRFGNKVFLNNGVAISCSSNIKIGSNCAIADECLIIDNDFHGVGDKLPKKAPIIIEDDVWLATRVIVLKGVTIGKGSVVGAGSVVTKSIPPNSFAAGAPAKVIRSI